MQAVNANPFSTKPLFGAVAGSGPRVAGPQVGFATPADYFGFQGNPQQEEGGGGIISKLIGFALAPFKFVLNLVTSLPIIGGIARFANNMLAKIGITNEKEKGEKLFG